MISLNLESYVFFRKVFNMLKESIQLVLTAFLNAYPTRSISTWLLASLFSKSCSSSISWVKSEMYAKAMRSTSGKPCTLPLSVQNEATQHCFLLYWAQFCTQTDTCYSVKLLLSTGCFWAMNIRNFLENYFVPNCWNSQ